MTFDTLDVLSGGTTVSTTLSFGGAELMIGASDEPDMPTATISGCRPITPRSWTAC